MPKYTRTRLKISGNRSDGVMDLRHLWFKLSSTGMEEVRREVQQPCVKHSGGSVMVSASVLEFVSKLMEL